MDILFRGGGGGGGRGHYEIGLFLLLFYFFFFGGGGSFLYILGRLRSRYRMGIFFGPQIFKYFWVYLIFLIFFFFLGGGGWGGVGVNSKCWVQAYV